MTEFIKRPNLPEGRVSSLICGGLNEELIRYFEASGAEIFFTQENFTVDNAVSKHADLSALYLGDGRIVVDRGQPVLTEKLREVGLAVTETEKAVEGCYPCDCILNHAIVGRHIIGKKTLFDEALKRLTSDFEVISVNQGYCKCSVLVVDENSIITDDESVARRAVEKGLNCLLISKGDVSLDGHEYGFIGGASGKILKDEIIFFGDISKHRDYERIEAFIRERKMRIISFDFPLTDFGGIIPIRESLL